ncbi:MAG TPA: DUF2628 domain-containing protein [Hyphomicrobium sp.]|nr:DUF2628 domain-containing protein [Hyphomicrobium sp.]
MLGLLVNGMARVSAFTVHEPPQGGGTKLERAEHMIFVRDGFSWRAALFGPFYLLVRGEWMALAAYIAAAALLSAIMAVSGAKTDWFVLAFILLNVLTGFEVSELKRWSLGRRGWQEIASVSGRGQEEAERRFFEAWLPTLPADAPDYERHGSAGPWSPPADDTTSRIEAAVRSLSTRLRAKYATKT